MKYLLSINYFFWLVVSTLFFAVGEFLSKKFALGPRWSIVILLVFIDVFSVLTWLPAILQKNQLSIVGTIWSVLSLLLTVTIGVIIFGEKLNYLSIAGIITAIIAIVLLTMS
jgi:multidrug transporter EmrE-like cation transporter